jgi:hypothetical protein
VVRVIEFSHYAWEASIFAGVYGVEATGLGLLRGGRVRVDEVQKLLVRQGAQVLSPEGKTVFGLGVFEGYSSLLMVIVFSGKGMYEGSLVYTGGASERCHTLGAAVALDGPLGVASWGSRGLGVRGNGRELLRRSDEAEGTGLLVERVGSELLELLLSQVHHRTVWVVPLACGVARLAVENEEARLAREISLSFSRLDGMKYFLCLVVVRVRLVFWGAFVRSYCSVGLGSRIPSVGLPDVVLRGLLLVHDGVRAFEEALGYLVLLA